MASNWVRILLASAACIAGLAVAGLARAVPANLQAPVTKIAEDFNGLHEYVMILVMLIFVGAFGAMFYSVYAHRKERGHKDAPFHKSTAVEIVWTAIPLIILVMLAWPATKVVIAQTDTSKAGVIIPSAEIKAQRN